ncbi:MAG: class I SAM-dependent methyltransferase [Acidimicrobiia bacterium]|nr:class I SAM-dependent methyltransferase [Acidimicrobiia bacterium]
MELPPVFAIRHSSHRILNPFDTTKLAALGEALIVERGRKVLDLGCGKGEMLCTWAREHDIVGTGVDINPPFVAAARARASELGVSDRVTILQGDATDWVSTDPVDIASCLGATWIGGGVSGTIGLLQRSLRPGGMILIGEPYWRAEPPDQETVEACHATSRDTFLLLPDLVRLFGEFNYDLVEMVLADEDTWDRYAAPQWLNIRRFLDANPEDPMADELRDELRTAPILHTQFQRVWLGWGAFALMPRG